MTETITTRRAIEVVLSRVCMHKEAKSCLMVALDTARRNPDNNEAPPIDHDAIRSGLEHMLYTTDNMDAHFTKQALIDRIIILRNEIRQFLGKP